MSFNSQLTLTNGSTPLVFDQTAIGSGYTTRRVAGQEPSEPIEMKISHSSSGSKQNSTILIDDYQMGVDGVTQERLRVLFKIERPAASSTFTNLEIKYLVDCLSNFLDAEANQDKLLNVES